VVRDGEFTTEGTEREIEEGIENEATFWGWGAFSGVDECLIESCWFGGMLYFGSYGC